MAKCEMDVEADPEISRYDIHTGAESATLDALLFGDERLENSKGESCGGICDI